MEKTDKIVVCEECRWYKWLYETYWKVDGNRLVGPDPIFNTVYECFGDIRDPESEEFHFCLATSSYTVESSPDYLRRNKKTVYTGVEHCRVRNADNQCPMFRPWL